MLKARKLRPRFNQSLRMPYLQTKNQHPTGSHHSHQERTQIRKKPKSFRSSFGSSQTCFVHAGIRLFNCDICNKSFTRSTNLAKHKRSHIVVPKNYRCMLCPKAFQSNDLLSRHMEIHMNRNTFSCKFYNLGESQYI